MSARKVLCFGGTFNPIHNGHLIVARIMAEDIGADKVIIIPNGVPPHKDSVLSIPHKVAMMERAISGDPLFELSKYEVDKATPSYTIETVRFMRLCQGDDAEIYWMIGPDNITDLVNWYKIEELVKECIFVAGSAGKEVSKAQRYAIDSWPFVDDLYLGLIDIPHLDIRSTTIRERIQEGLSIRHYVPDAVADYIRKHELYKTDAELSTV